MYSTHSSCLAATLYVHVRCAFVAVRGGADWPQADGTLAALLSERAVLRGLLALIDGQAPLEPDGGVREQAALAVLCAVESDEGRGVLWELGAAESLRKGCVRLCVHAR